jgi:homopolymeric O-antigen transport system ATP-binding protein
MPNSDDVLIKVENVSKKFCRSLKRSMLYGMEDISRDLLHLPNTSDKLRKDEFWAVDDVSFEVKRGECLGIIGRNGAGKSTLLKMLNGIILPDKGKITIKGKVGALIEVGAGFHPMLTGRENIYVNGAILGMSKREIDKKFDEIVAFAELEEFIDMPVKHYSSGMYVRLGFSIAVQIKPDILILDEILAVGDAGFRHKCYHQINKVMKDAAVIMVSHSMDYIGHATSKVLMMTRGKSQGFNNPMDGIAAYNQENSLLNNSTLETGKIEIIYPPISNVSFKLTPIEIRYSTPLTVEVEIECENDIPDIIFSFVAVSISEQPVMCWHSTRYPKKIDLIKGWQRLRFIINPVLLHQGEYTWNFCLTQRGKIEHIIWYMRAGHFHVTSQFRPLGNIPYIPSTDHFELELR